jgi:hypothetical protein
MATDPDAFTSAEEDMYPQVAAVRTALRAEDWPGAQAQFDDQPADVRTRLIRFGAHREFRPFLQKTVADHPGDTAAVAMLGDLMTKDAWAVRSNQRARHVSAEQFAQFHAMLAETERMLGESTAVDPTDPAVWVSRLVVARGLELGLSEARRRYARLADLDPHHLSGQSQLLQQLCPKWGGTFDELHAFAREAMRAAPAGAHNAVLVADAHLEHAIDESGQANRYLSGIRGELMEAAERSVFHPAFQRTVGWVDVCQTFAFVLVLAGEKQAAARLFEATGPYIGNNPWQYYPDPRKMFHDTRKRAARKFRLW